MTSCTILAPLNSFGWTGTEFAEFVVADLGSVGRFTKQPDVSAWLHLLAVRDRQDIAMASHWLEFRHEESESLSASEKINMFLLSLWLVKPTKVHVKFKFKSCDDGDGDAARFLSRFEWMEEDVRKDAYTKGELHSASQYFAAMLKVAGRRRRVWNALVLTFQACIASQWQVKIVCFSAAVEALLKYQEHKGIARQVARSYACLVESTKRARDREYRAFRRSYETRSEVVHGRADRLRMATRLKKLASIAVQLRRVWHEVLLSPALWRKLDGDDASRKALLEEAERGYEPPF